MGSMRPDGASRSTSGRASIARSRRVETVSSDPPNPHLTLTVAESASDTHRGVKILSTIPVRRTLGSDAITILFQGGSASGQ
jgi:hypothetical protein